MADAENARSKRDYAALIRIGGELERLGNYAEAWLALTQGAEIRKLGRIPVWPGPGTRTKCLLVRRYIRHVGAELRNARFIDCALGDVERVIVATEPRLIPLLRRSFPKAEYMDLATASLARDVDFECSYERLAYYYGPDGPSIEETFKPLIAARASQLTPEGIGIAWHSSNNRKPLPALEDWAGALASFNLPILSLQYAEDDAGIARLSELIGHFVRPSHPVDQMIDVDGFANQVASVRGVLTISNTTAHMAGALGVPCVVLLDDLQHLTWPASGAVSPFYPSVHIIRQDGLPWRQVIANGLRTLQEMDL